MFIVLKHFHGHGGNVHPRALQKPWPLVAVCGMTLQGTKMYLTHFCTVGILTSGVHFVNRKNN